MESHSLVLRDPLDVPTHRCGAALDIILATRSLSCHVAVHRGSICCSVAPLCCPLFASDHFLCSCRVNFPQFVPASPGLTSTMPRVRDWSSVVASCHVSLTEWHQSVLSLSSSPLSSAPQRVSALDAVSSLTQILTLAARHHSTLHSQEATPVVERRLLPRPRRSQLVLA